MIDPAKHEQILESTLTDIRAGVFDDIKSLENQIAELVATGGAPATIRPQLLAAFQQTGEQAARNAGEVKRLSQDVQESSDIPATPEDQIAEQALTDQTKTTVKNTVTGAAESIMEVIVLGAAAGTATELLARQVRGRISGVFMESSDPVVRRTQRQLTKLVNSGKAEPAEVQKAVRTIRDRLTGVNTTASLRDLTSKTVEETVMKFDGAFIAGKAERAGIERFQYAGGSIDTTRPWCSNLDGEILTKDEIYELWDSSDWQGKEPGDPFIVRGGYNCRHFWIPVEED